MQAVDEKVETIHLYVVRESDKRPSWLPAIISLIALSILVAIGVVTPYTQPVTRASIRVPAVPLGFKTFTASTPVIPTGIKTYPATIAYGRLLIRNGSVIGQSIPAGFVVSGVATDTAVYVPGATADGDGYATATAHVVMAGVNLPAFAVDTVIGASLFIRNPEPFTGAHPAYSVKYVTEQDKQTAIEQARSQLRTSIAGFHYPCSEVITSHMTLTWRCQFVTYHLPSYLHVSSARLIGSNFLIAVWFIAYPKRIWVK